MMNFQNRHPTQRQKAQKNRLKGRLYFCDECWCPIERLTDAVLNSMNSHRLAWVQLDLDT